MATMRIGIAQMKSTDDPWENLFMVQTFHQEAVERKVDLLCFPENTFFRGPRTGGSYARSESHVSVTRQSDHSIKINRDGQFAEEMDDFFKQIKMPLSLGSVLEVSGNNEKPANSHWIVFPEGNITSYQKIHLFDYASTENQYRESDDVIAGKEVVSTLIKGVKTGLSICFDLRFSELYRNLTLHHKTQLLLIPAAFTSETGEKHWHALLRARAIENLSYVVAAGQWGSHKNAKGTELFCYGHSLIYDPWGDVVTEAPGKGDCLVVADLDFEMLKKVRSKLPALEAAGLSLSFESR